MPDCCSRSVGYERDYPQSGYRNRDTGQQTGDGTLRRATSYVADNSLMGRTSTLPTRAGGIFDANWIASFKSLASIR